MGDILDPEDKERLQENLLVGPAKASSEAASKLSKYAYVYVGTHGNFPHSFPMGFCQVSLKATFAKHCRRS